MTARLFIAWPSTTLACLQASPASSGIRHFMFRLPVILHERFKLPRQQSRPLLRRVLALNSSHFERCSPLTLRHSVELHLPRSVFHLDALMIVPFCLSTLVWDLNWCWGPGNNNQLILLYLKLTDIAHSDHLKLHPEVLGLLTYVYFITWNMAIQGWS